MGTNSIKSYKGFDKDLKCKGFQYEVGKEYEMEDIEICKRGFHACENPFDIFNYYDMLDSRFCEVEQSGVIQREGNDTKICSSKIKIIRELKLRDMINLGIEWLNKSTSQSRTTSGNIINDNGHVFSRIGSSGNLAQIGSSGDSAQIGSSGNLAQIGSSGNLAQIGSSGNYVKIGSSGNLAQIGSSGNYVQIGSSGNYVKIGSSGNLAQIGSSGNFVQIESSGNYVRIGSSGDSAQIGSSGNLAQIGSSGNYVQIGSSGNYVKIGSSGDYAQINSEGEDSVIMCAGINSMAKAKRGSWITLAEWTFSEEKNRIIPILVKTEYVDGERIKENVWYELVNGEFVEQDN